jgi:NAD(P)-dependent dehydrogenase (short-subunit alcohol dehydrogenase family)
MKATDIGDSSEKSIVLITGGSGNLGRSVAQALMGQ